MYRTLRRSAGVIAILGMLSGSVYVAGLVSLKSHLRNVLKQDIGLGYYKLNRLGNITSLHDLEIVDSRGLPNVYVDQVFIEHRPHALASGRFEIDRIVAEGVSIRALDRVNNLLLREANELQKLSESHSLASETAAPESPDVSKIIESSLVSWKSEWDTVLVGYQSEIARLSGTAGSFDAQGFVVENPLRDRQILQAQISSIKLLEAEIAKVEADIRSREQKLVSDSKAIERNCLRILTDSESANSRLWKSKQQKITQVNLDVMRNALTGYLLRSTLGPLQIVNNVATASNNLMQPPASIPASRGEDYWEQFNQKPNTLIKNVLLRGSTDLGFMDFRFDATCHEAAATQDANRPFVIVLSSSLPTDSVYGSRLTGNVSDNGDRSWQGEYSGKGIVLTSDLLTEPNFKLTIEADHFNVEGHSSEVLRSQEVEWSAKAIKLIEIRKDANTSTELEPIAFENVSAHLTYSLNTSNTPDFSVELAADFLDTAADQLLMRIENENIAFAVPIPANQISASVRSQTIALEQELQFLDKRLQEVKSSLSTQHQLFVRHLSPQNVRTARLP